MDQETFSKVNFGIVYAFVLIMIILFIFSISTDYFGRVPSSRDGSSIPEDYFDQVEPWGENTFISNPLDLETSGFTLRDDTIDFSKCNWFSYETILPVIKNPNIKTGLSDYLRGFSHQSEPQECFDEDQLVFKRASRKCDGKGVGKCFGTDGTVYPRDGKEEYNFNCLGEIPLCSGTLGSLSFNFYQRSKLSPIESETRIMTIEKIFVSQKTFDDIDEKSTTQFYTREGKVFETNTNFDLEDDQFYPLISYTGKQDQNFKQLLRITRFKFQGRFVPDQLGPYAEIVFRPYNLYLDIEFNKSKNQPESFEHVELPSGGNLYKKDSKIRRIYTPERVDTKTTCTCQIVGTTVTLNIYKRGEDEDIFRVEKEYFVENDNGEVTDDSLKVKVKTLTDFSSFLVFKKVEKSVKKWLLVPPLDIGGGKVLPRTNHIEKMRVFRRPLFEIRRPPDERLFNDAVNTGTSWDSDENKFILSENLFSESSGFVGKGDKALNRSPVDLDVGSDILKRKGQNPVWWIKRETRFYYTSRPNIVPIGGGDLYLLRRETKNMISTIVYNVKGKNVFSNSDESFPNNHWENYLVSIGNNNGQANGQASDFFNVLTRNNLAIYTGRENFGSRTDIKTAAIGFYLEDRRETFTPGDILRAGTIVWLVVDPKPEINVYSGFYFFSENFFGAPVTDFTLDPGSEQKIGYKNDVIGTVSIVFFENYSTRIENTELSLANAVYEKVILKKSSGEGDCLVNIQIVEGEIGRISVVPGREGTGYSNTETYSVTLKNENVDVVTFFNIRVLTKDIIYFLTALPISGDRKPVSEDGFVVASGFFLNTEVSVQDGRLVFPTGDLSDTISLGGYGYRPGDKLYINQVSQIGESVFSLEDTPNMVSLQVEEVANTENIKTKSLLSELNDDETLRSTSYYEYNFYEKDVFDNSSLYTSSPPQIAFIDPEDDSITDYIKSGDPDEFISYLFRNTGGGPTSFTRLYTLQYPKLNYRVVPENPDEKLVNGVSKFENLVLGKFIPYSGFGSENKEFSEKKIYNANNTRFIPRGIQDIYNRVLSETDIPSF